MSEKNQPVHPLGSRARVLLASVFGPYARDDEYGSRKINPMELYQNQVTRVQGGFSLRMFHRSFGLMMIQNNLDAPCTLLDFPTLEGFTAEITENSYDIIGIGAILPNIGKVREMCKLIRRHQPTATIVIGGHISNKEGLHELIDADHIVRGEGIRWFQRYLGQDDRRPIKHPLAISGFGGRMMGIDLGNRPGGTAAILIPSVGCPMGCNFCSTSALFGGKGKFVNFFETGDELFAAMCEMEKKLKVKSFFTLDENFLLHKKRALRLLELMEANRKSWAIYVFSSARVLQSYTIDQLVRLGIGWVWMGLEGEESAYDKLQGVDTRALVTCCRITGSASWVHRSSASKATGRKIWMPSSIMRSATRRSSTSSCSTRRFRARPCTKNTGRTGRSCRRRSSPSPIPTGSIASITATRISGTAGKKSIFWRPSGRILR